MRRVVITGMGIWSSIGQDLQTVTESLKKGRSGIIFDQSRLDYGLQSGLVGNVPRPDLTFLPRQERIMLSEDAEYAYMAARQAFEQSGLTDELRNNQEVGIIWSNDMNSHQKEFLQIMEQEHCPALIGYNALPKSAVASAAMNLAQLFHLSGINMNVSAACPGGIHAMGVASMYIQSGMQDIILVGGSFENNNESLYQLTNDATFIDTRYNATPHLASRPFDKAAVGAIPSGGAAALVLEEYEHAVARGATVLAEVTGYGFANGHVEAYYKPMWKPILMAMQKAIQKAKLSVSELSLIMSYADSWLLSAQTEAIALSKFCESHRIPITATESITGHEGTMSGVARTIFSVLMMQEGFIAPTINLTDPIDEAKDLHIIKETTPAQIDKVLITAGGLGGIFNAIVIQRQNT